MKKLGGYFINGFLVFVPFAATVGLITWSMEFIDGLMPFDVPGVGLGVLFILIPLTGFLASNYIGKTLFDLLDKLLNKMPVCKASLLCDERFDTSLCWRQEKFRSACSG